MWIFFSLYQKSLLILTFFTLNTLVTGTWFYSLSIWSFLNMCDAPCWQEWAHTGPLVEEMYTGKPLKNILNHISTPRKFAFKSIPMLSKVWVTRCKEHKFPSMQRWLNKPWFIHTENNATLERHEVQLDVPIKRRPRHLAKWKGKLPKRVLPL